MPSPRPLEGRTILLTRPERESRALAARLTALGARVVVEPVVAFESLAEGEAAQAVVGQVGGYDLVVFTSANGVRFFADALRRAGRSASDVRGRVAAVGPGTARALEGVGLPAHVVAAESTAEGLTEALREEVPKGARVLVARPESSRDVLACALRAAGAEVDEAVLYRTVAGPRAGAAAAALAEGGLDAVVLASPSALRFLLEASGEGRPGVEEALRRVERIAIGTVTAAALDAAGLAPSAVAGEPTDEGLLSAVLRALED